MSSRAVCATYATFPYCLPIARNWRRKHGRVECKGNNVKKRHKRHKRHKGDLHKMDIMDIEAADMPCMELYEELKERPREFRRLQGPGMEKYKALLVREHARGIKKVGALRAELEAERKARQGGSTAPGWQTWWKWGQGKLRQLRAFLALKPRGKCGSGQLAHLPHSLEREARQKEAPKGLPHE